MASFAHITNGIVDQVIAIEPEVLEQAGGWICHGCNMQFKPKEEWVQTSYNTRWGKHFDPNTGLEDAKPPLRKNHASVGDAYDSARDAFIPRKRFPSWILNEDTCTWEAPKVKPPYCGEWLIWDEAAQTWKDKNGLLVNADMLCVPTWSINITVAAFADAATTDEY